MSILQNTKNVPWYLLGPGSFDRLGELVDARRGQDLPVFFYVDEFFQDKPLLRRLPVRKGDAVIFVDTAEEPSVEYVDALANGAKGALDGKLPCCLVGVGGGATLDVCKAVANLLTNPGRAEDYQGWDLVSHPAVYKIGVPTLSGTGSECSRTCVLLNQKKMLKLGMNSDHTMFDQLLLDPELTRTVPRDQFFYSGLDTFMHCFESRRGSYRNVIIDALAKTGMELCQEIFLGPEDMMSADNREKMMVASYLGGMSAGTVGAVHPISAGLSVVLHVPHGLANCYALSVLEDIYPEEYAQFREMLSRQKVSLPAGICRNLTGEQYEALYRGTIVHERPLANALGPDFRDIFSRDKLIEMFKRM